MYSIVLSGICLQPVLMQVGVLGCQSIAIILSDEECTHKVPVIKSPRLPCACS